MLQSLVARFKRKRVEQGARDRLHDDTALRRRHGNTADLE